MKRVIEGKGGNIYVCQLKQLMQTARPESTSRNRRIAL